MAESVESHSRTYTPPKGRATPKRRDAEGKARGPVPKPPSNTREAMKRNKELRKTHPKTKEQHRSDYRYRQQRIAEGDDRYLPARDRGPVKAYARDLVDSRRYLTNLFMPVAVLVLIAIVVPSPVLRSYVQLVVLLLFVVMIVEGFFTARRITRLARAKFPKETISGASLGWYAFVRASQIRPLRMPKPRVKPGDSVS